MFRVAIKDSARERDAGVRAFLASESATQAFPSRAAAEAFRERVAAGPDALRLQAAAANDPADVDAYLVPDAQTDEWRPVEADGRSATFAVGANAYGSLGTALLYFDGRVAPALRWYFSEVAPTERRGRVTATDLEPSLPPAIASSVGWRPDLRIEVARTGDEAHPSPGDGTPAGTDVYFAEVKTGDASFERDQRADMQRIAERVGVLTVRVRIEALPATYEVRIDEVGPDERPGAPRT